MGSKPWNPEGLSVLVVDDLQVFREMYSSYFAFAGVGVSTAIDGHEALQFARLYPPDAIVLDLSMQGMSGWVFLKELRADPALSHIPVIVLTAYSTEDDVLSAGADALLAKPCLPATLLAEVRRVASAQSAVR
jgi:two-component system, cell cycle response regulator DivK